MMKKTVAALLLFVGFGVFAQTQTHPLSPQQTVELFFDAFHQQDTVAMRSLTYGDLDLKSIGKDKTGNVQIVSERFNDFLRSISSIPENVDFQEKIHGYEVKTDGAMAHVWTPYSFFVNGKLSHCGVNSFQLYKEHGVWKIISIVDTRRNENCAE